MCRKITFPYFLCIFSIMDRSSILFSGALFRGVKIDWKVINLIIFAEVQNLITVEYK